jgi:hypothetical protein
MKHTFVTGTFVTGLFSVSCLWLAACSAVQPVASSGAAQLPAPVTTLSVYASPDFKLVEERQRGDTDLGRAFEPGLQRFAVVFARDFTAQFPPMLASHGVAVADAAPELPQLRVRLAGHHSHCKNYTTSTDCQIEVRMAGQVRVGKTQVWSFEDWLDPGEMDPAGFQRVLDALMAAMVHDGVVPPAAATAR